MTNVKIVKVSNDTATELFVAYEETKQGWVARTGKMSRSTVQAYQARFEPREGEKPKYKILENDL